LSCYHASWDRSDNALTDAVRTSVAKNEALDFDMPADTGFDDGSFATWPVFRDTSIAPRLYDAVENGVADLADPMLKDRIAELKATRDQARAATSSGATHEEWSVATWEDFTCASCDSH
jgi:hypothetical protein